MDELDAIVFQMKLQTEKRESELRRAFLNDWELKAQIMKDAQRLIVITGGYLVTIDEREIADEVIHLFDTDPIYRSRVQVAFNLLLEYATFKTTDR